MANYKLQILHHSDGEAGLLAPDTAPYLAALTEAFEREHANTLILSGGDNFIPGPFGAAGTDPSISAVLGGNTAFFRADVAIQNALGVEVSAIGNHEWDLGSNVFNDALTANGNFPGAQFALVSANLDVSGDSALRGRADSSLGGTAGDLAGAEASTIKGKIVPWTTVTEGGEKIGIVGATTQILERISSPSGTEVAGFPKAGDAGDNTEVDDMDLLAAQLQPMIDEMIASGIDKIILQSHLQSLGNERLLATKLSGVDIILGAGSNTRLGDATDEAVAFPGHDATFADTYPIVTQGLDGKSTLIVNTDNEYTYLGRLVVEFDENGDIVLSSIDANESGAYAATKENVAKAWNDGDGDLSDTAFAEGTRGDRVADITKAVDQVLLAKDGTIYGYTNVYLEGERSQVRSQETNLGNLTADANAAAARQALGGDETFVVSLKNGGGIRAQIGSISSTGGSADKLPPVANEDAGKPAGAISQLDIENALRFNNKMMVFDTTPQGLLNILEFAAGIANNSGGFPQIGGMSYSYDEGAPLGSRIKSVALLDENGDTAVKLVENGQVVAGAPAKFSAVVLNFTANGGDGYPIKANGENFRYILNDGTLSAPVDKALDFASSANVPANALGEQQALGDYLKANHGTPDKAYDRADVPEGQDARIQNLDLRSDTVFANLPNVVVVADGETRTDGVALTDDDRLLIEDGGTLANTITWTGEGDVTVDNNGTVEAARILNVQKGVAGSLVFNNLEGALAKGAFNPTSAGAADALITLNNAGTIEANGRTIDWRSFDNNGASGIVNNLAGGIIRQTGTNTDVIRPGADGEVSNWGTISADRSFVGGGDLIDFQSDRGGKVYNHAGGTMEGARHVVTGDFAVSVTNDGTMIARNGAAVNIDNDGAAENTVNVLNRGLMEGRAAGVGNGDGDAIDVDGLLALQNYGRVAGLGANGDNDGEPNLSEGIAIGGGSITNYAGASIYGYGRAIQVDNSSNGEAFGATRIVNDGLIQGDGNGPAGVGAADAARFDLRGNEAINLIGDRNDEIVNNGTGRIVGGVSMGGGSDTLDNSGSIAATGGSAIDMGAGNDTVTLHAGATVTGVILLGSGDDRLTGSAVASNLRVDGGAGRDLIATGTGDDTLLGGAGDDELSGGGGDDRLDGGVGADLILGGAGNDSLAGGTGNDRLDGGVGSDLLMGGKGVDALFGGAGNDTFAFGASDFDDALGSKPQDFIYDFKGAGGQSGAENDFIRFTGFGAGSTLTKVTDPSVTTMLEANAPGSSYYTVFNTANGRSYTLSIKDGGETLTAGDYAFYGSVPAEPSVDLGLLI